MIGHASRARAGARSVLFALALAALLCAGCSGEKTPAGRGPQGSVPVTAVAAALMDVPLSVRAVATSRGPTPSACARASGRAHAGGVRRGQRGAPGGPAPHDRSAPLRGRAAGGRGGAGPGPGPRSQRPGAGAALGRPRGQGLRDQAAVRRRAGGGRGCGGDRAGRLRGGRLGAPEPRVLLDPRADLRAHGRPAGPRGQHGPGQRRAAGHDRADRARARGVRRARAPPARDPPLQRDRDPEGGARARRPTRPRRSWET